MRKTKIVCTIGPASSTTEVMEKLLNAGLNVARFNFSHGSHESQGEMIDSFRKARDRQGVAAAVLLDTKGPEIRLKNFAAGKVLIKNGDTFTLTTNEIEGDEKAVSVTYKDLPKELKKGDTVLINDGLVSLEVLETTDTDVVCRVMHGGKISDHKGINLPNVDIGMEFMSEQDRSDLLFGIEKSVDYIAASFTRTAEDVRSMRDFLAENGGEDIRIIAKIESTQGIKNFEEILDAADGIMVARGDLGVEVAYEQLPGFQKKMIRSSTSKGKIVITATQMLESMTASPLPTRAEVSDVANAVFDGTTAVMLSEESAAGQYPVEAVAAMAKIVEQAEKDLATVACKDSVYEMNYDDFTNAVAHAACTLAEDAMAKAIVAITSSGYTAIRIAKFRPDLPIIGVTTDERVFHRMALYKGVLPLLSDEAEVSKHRSDLNETGSESYQGIDQDIFTWCASEVSRAKLVTEGDRIVLTAGIPFGGGNTNAIRLLNIK